MQRQVGRHGGEGRAEQSSSSTSGGAARPARPESLVPQVASGEKVIDGAACALRSCGCTCLSGNVINIHHPDQFMEGWLVHPVTTTFNRCGHLRLYMSASRSGLQILGEDKNEAESFRPQTPTSNGERELMQVNVQTTEEEERQEKRRRRGKEKKKTHHTTRWQNKKLEQGGGGHTELDRYSHGTQGGVGIGVRGPSSGWSRRSLGGATPASRGRD